MKFVSLTNLFNRLFRTRRRKLRTRKYVAYPLSRWTCPSVTTFECTSPAEIFATKTVNEKKFLSTQSLTFILTENQSNYNMVCCYFCYFNVKWKVILN